MTDLMWRKLMKKLKSMADFGIKPEQLHDDVFQLSNNVNLQKRMIFQKEYETPLDKYAILYYFRFVEKLESSEIANILGIHNENVHHLLYSLGWHFSNDYEENKAILQEKGKKLTEILQRAKNQSQKLKTEEHPILLKALQSKVRINKNSYISMNFTSREEYIRAMYYLFHIEDLTTVEMALLFKRAKGVINTKLRNLGFNISHEESIARKKKKGR